MEVATNLDDGTKEKLPPATLSSPDITATGVLISSSGQQQQQQQKTKRKHRRGKPKAKNANKPYKKTNWRFQVPRYNCNYNNGGGSGAGGGGGGNGGSNSRTRAKLMRSRSLVPYNTNKFLMEEHLAEIPSSLLTPSGRTRDSSFSVDSEDNYFFSLPEDEEEFLTKEFANVYEKARVERLENLTKQELIEECLQIEDRFSTDQGAKHQQQLNIQRISAEFLSKIRGLEEKVKELTRENYNLRCQLMRSAALAAAAAASPPSAAAPTGAACEPTPMDSTSEDSESDSSSSSSSSSGSAYAPGEDNNDQANACLARRRRSSSRSSLSDYNDNMANNYMPANAENDINEEDAAAVAANVDNDDEQEQLLGARIDDEDENEITEVLEKSNASADPREPNILALCATATTAKVESAKSEDSDKAGSDFGMAGSKSN